MEKREEEEVRKQLLENKKIKIEEAEADAKRRREEEVDDSKIVSFTLYRLQRTLGQCLLSWSYLITFK